MESINKQNSTTDQSQDPINSKKKEPTLTVEEQSAQQSIVSEATVIFAPKNQVGPIYNKYKIGDFRMEQRSKRLQTTYAVLQRYIAQDQVLQGGPFMDSSLGPDLAPPKLELPVTFETRYKNFADVDKFVTLYARLNALADSARATYGESSNTLVSNLSIAILCETQAMLAKLSILVEDVLKFHPNDVDALRLHQATCGSSYTYPTGTNPCFGMEATEVLTDLKREFNSLIVSMPILAQPQALFGIDHNIRLDTVGITSLFDSIRDSLKDFGAKLVDSVVGIGAQLYILFTNLTNLPMISAALVTIVALCGGISGLKEMLSSLIYSMVEGIQGAWAGGGASAQDGLKTDITETASTWWMKIIQNFGALIFTISFVIIMRSLPGKGTIDELLNRLRAVGGSVNSIKMILDASYNSMKTACNYLYEAIYGTKPADPGGYAHINDWMDSVQKITTTEFDAELRSDKEKVALVERLYVEGLEHFRTLSALRAPAAEMTAFNAHFATVMRFQQASRASIGGKTGFRSEPLVIQLWGGSGAGKSVCLNYINALVGTARGAKNMDEVNAMVYSRKTAQDFWDGYHGQPIINYDDFGAIKDTEANPNVECIELIHQKNNQSYNLHMASLLEKANTFYQGEVVILTSNQHNYHMPSMTYKPAVQRRIDLQFFVTVRPEFGRQVIEEGEVKWRIDSSKIDATNPESVLAAYQFFLTDPEDSNLPPVGPVNFQEVADLIIEQLASNEKRNVDLHAGLDAFISRRNPEPSGDLVFRAQVRADPEIPSCPHSYESTGYQRMSREEREADAVRRNNMASPTGPVSPPNRLDIEARKEEIRQRQRERDAAAARVEEYLAAPSTSSDEGSTYEAGQAVRFDGTFRAFYTYELNDILIEGYRRALFEYARETNEYNRVADCLGRMEGDVTRTRANAMIAVCNELIKTSPKEPGAMSKLVAVQKRYTSLMLVAEGQEVAKSLEPGFFSRQINRLASIFARKPRDSQELPKPPAEFVPTKVQLCDGVFWNDSPHNLMSLDQVNGFVQCVEPMMTNSLKEFGRRFASIWSTANFGAASYPVHHMVSHRYQSPYWGPISGEAKFPTGPPANPLNKLEFEIHELVKDRIDTWMTSEILIPNTCAFPFAVGMHHAINSPSAIWSPAQVFAANYAHVLNQTMTCSSIGGVNEIQAAYPLRLAQACFYDPKDPIYVRLAARILDTQWRCWHDLVPIRCAADPKRETWIRMSYSCVFSLITFTTTFAIYKFGVALVKRIVAGIRYMLSDYNKLEDNDIDFFKPEPPKVDEAAINAATVLLMATPELASSGDSKTRAATQRFVREAFVANPNVSPAALKDKLLHFYGTPAGESAKVASAQGLIDQNSNQIMADMMRNNQYKLEVQTPGTENYVHAATVTFIEGRRAITIAHAAHHLAGKNFRLRGARYPDGIYFHYSEVEYYFPDKENPIYSHRDVMLMEFPPRVAQHPSILKHLGESCDFNQYLEVDSATLIGYAPGPFPFPRVYVTRGVRANVEEFTCEVVEGKRFIFTRSFRYDIETVPGDCGAILLSTAKHHQRKIIGLHVAGTTIRGMTGISAPLSRGFYEHLANQAHPWSGVSPPPVNAVAAESVFVSKTETVNGLKVSDINNQDLTLKEVPRQTCAREFEELQPSTLLPGFMCYGLVDDGIVQPPKSNVHPSPIHGMITEPVTAPARLKAFRNEDGELIDPRELSRLKVKITPSRIDAGILEECMEDMRSMIKVPTTRGRVLTVAEAIRGVPGDQFIEPMVRTTSPGYPLIKSKLPGCPGKTTWLGSGENYVVDDTTLLKLVNDRLYEARHLRRTLTYWLDVLKDERRPLDRVAAGKTRMINVAPLDYTICFRMYFGDFIAHVMDNRVAVESCVGINAYSGEWSVLAQRMSAFPNVLAGDFSNFDGTLQADILWRIVHFINDWYDDGPESRQIRYILWAEVVNSLHLIATRHNGNLAYVVYAWNQSQPSGNPMTVIINSLYNSIVCRYVYILLAHHGDADIANMRGFRDNVRLANYGDDNLWSISNRAAEFMTMPDITAAFKYIGMTYTSETKKAGCDDFRDLSEVSFLKRKFRYDRVQARYLAPLSLPVILEMAMWVRGRRQIHELTTENIETACYELALHGQKTYDAHIDAFKVAASDAQLDPAPVFRPWRRIMESEYTRYVDPNARFLHGELDESAQTEIFKGQSGTQGDIEGSGVVDQHQIVQFEDLGDYMRGGLEMARATNTGIRAQETRDHTVKDFLERPYLDTTVQWNLTHPDLHILWSRNFPEVVTNTPVIKDKLSGFRFYRFRSLTIRVQVNSQPFQQGILLIFAMPYYADSPHNASITQLQTLTGVSGYRLRAIVNLAEAKNGELEIPWVHIRDQVTTRNDHESLYTVKAVVYCPLRGGNPVDVSFWWQLNGVEPTIPTGATAVAYGMSGEVSTYQAMPDEEQINAGGTSFSSATNTVAGAVITASGKGMAREVAAASSRDGTITKVAKAAALTASVASLVPVLTPFAAPIAAVSGLAATFASIFGWSKPTTEATTDVMNLRMARQQQNALGSDEAKIWSVDPRNALSRAPLYGSNIDEMSIKYLVSTPSYFESFSWDVGKDPDAKLYSAAAHPCQYSPVPEVGALRVTTLGYVTAMNRYWRGSIVFRFHVSKTPSMHAGRLLIYLVPGGVSTIREDNPANNTYTPYTAGLCVRRVVDIASIQGHFDVRVPYLSMLPWMPTEIEKSNSDFGLGWPAFSSIWLAQLTALHIVVLNRLVCPSIASDTIDFRVEVFAGDDFEVAGPDAIPWYPLWLSNGQIPPPPALKETEEEVLAYGMAGDDLIGTTDCGDIHQNTMGERICGVKQYLNRQAQVISPPQSDLPQNYVFISDTFPNCSNTNDARLNATEGDVWSAVSYFEAFSPLYAFSRGGWRMNIFAHDAGVSLTSTQFSIRPIYTTASKPENRNILFPAHTKSPFLPEIKAWKIPGTVHARFNPTYEGMVEYGRPWYIGDAYSARNPWYSNQSLIADWIRLSSDKLDQYQIYIAPADDFQFGFVVGPPLVRRPTVTVGPPTETSV